MKPIPGVLILEDGTRFQGKLWGAPTSADTVRQSIRNLATQNLGQNKDHGFGEVVFNTSMTGYQEILTDPSYFGQIICMTVPHIGNTGTNLEDPESHRSWCSGFVIHELSEDSSHWRSKSNLSEYLIQLGIPALHGIDTRTLTRHLRSKGVCRGLILPDSESSEAADLFKELPSFEGRDLISEVSTKKSYFWDDSVGHKYKVVAVDFGVKANLLRSLSKLGCEVEVVPAHTSAQEILNRKPNGVFLSNGPGDPQAAPYAVEMVRQILGKVPVFGVCMGHQILGLAAGAKTFKLKFGHRGGNQPVLEKYSGHVEISSHNHGYAIDAASLPSSIQVTHFNLNDKTVEGIELPTENAFSVQYHPEACPGPHDSMKLFEKFIQKMNNNVSKIS